MVDFVHLHAHTNLGSMLDALISVDELFGKVKEFDQKALAITEHGTLFSHFDAYKASKKTGVKFIPGCEIYMVYSYDEFTDEKSNRKKTEKRKHLILLAKNHTGYKNLLKLNYIGFKNNVVVVGRQFPRISLSDLEQHSEGLICTSACAGGPISVLITQDKLSEAEEMAQKLADIFKNNFYLEIQPHLLKDGDLSQDKLNRQLIYISQKFGLPLTVGVDIHYLTKAHEKYHDVLLAIRDKKPIDDETRHRYGVDEFYVKTGDEVFSFLEKHYGKDVAKEAVGNTVKIADSCDEPSYMEFTGNHLPVFDPSKESDYEDFKTWLSTRKFSNPISEDKAYMRYKCIQGFKNKFPNISPEQKNLYWEQVKKELEVLEEHNFSSYMLIVADFINWAKDNGVLVGPGRGCLVGETPVYLSSGKVKHLKDLNIDDCIISHTGESRKITNKFEYNIDEDLINIQTLFGSNEGITLTKDHKIFGCKRDERIVREIKACDLEQEDLIFYPKIKRDIKDIKRFDLSKYVSFNDEFNFDSELIRKGDEVCVNRFIEIDDFFMWVLGKWIGFGTLNDSWNIRFCIQETSSIIKVKQWLVSNNIEFSEFKTHRDVELKVVSNPFVLWWKTLFPKSVDGLQIRYIPDFVVNLKDDLIVSLIMGFIDNNSRINRSKVDVFRDNLEICEQFKFLLLCLNIPAFARRVKKEFSVEFPIIGKLCEALPEFKEYNYNYPYALTNDGLFCRITKIKEVSGVDRVYDITVENDSSYLTACGSVHNSVGGCFTAFLLGIHIVNPFDYGLFFERFQNAEKKDLPDIDIDFTSAGRDLVKEYVKQKYGYDNCAAVSNFNSFSPKNVIPDLVKSMRNVIQDLIPEGKNYVAVSNAIKDAIPEEDGDKKKVKTIERALELSPELKRFAERSPELMEYAKHLVGLPKEPGTHAAGIIICDKPIVDIAPLRVDKDGNVAVQMEKTRCEASGLVKMDFLAIRTLDIIDEAISNIKKMGMDGPKRVEDIPLNDKETYAMLSKGFTNCVFQLGKSGIMPALCKMLIPENITDIATINALGRPSSSQEERREYAERKAGKKAVSFLHPSLERALGPTYGIGVFEEQLMLIASDVAGWNLNRADGLRKLTKLKGKNPELAEKLELDFIEGAMKKHNMSYEIAREIWYGIILPFAGYGFNKAHAVFYSINTYITAFLKCHYPAAYMAAYLKLKSESSGITKEDEVDRAKVECKRLGIKIIPPDVNSSSSGYEVFDEKTIVMGLAAVKGMGQKAIEEVVKNQPYVDFKDFLYRTEARVINKSKLEVLAKAGCFDSFNLSRKFIFENGKAFRDKLATHIKKRAKEGFNEQDALEDFYYEIISEEWSKRELLGYEMEVLGELVSGNIGDLYPGFFTGFVVTPISQLKRLPDRQPIISEFVIKSMLREFKIKSGRYAGQLMIKYSIMDIYGTETELTVWPSEYDKAKKYLNEGTPARAKCQISEFNSVKTIMLREIEKVYKDGKVISF